MTVKPIGSDLYSGEEDRNANPTESGDFVFRNPGCKEFIRLCGDGKIFVKGEEVEDNSFAYKAFKRFVKGSQKIFNKGKL